MKIAIGTAQFGMRYGVSNDHGQVPQPEAKSLLDWALEAGITTLDTASSYGESERRLGGCGAGRFDVVSKVKALPSTARDIESWVLDEVEKSIELLRVEALQGCLVHSPEDLLGPRGDKIYKAMLSAKEQGLARNIGVSIYSPAQLDELVSRYMFDIVQAPMNVFDRRLHSSGWLHRLSEQGIQVHVRSIFLQGLLLMRPDQRPSYFQQWWQIFSSYDRYIEKTSCSALEACIGFIKQFTMIDTVIIGLTSLSQLKRIYEIFLDEDKILVPDGLQSEELGLIDPSNWRL